MRTAILDDLGLVASLKDLCSQFSERHPDIALDFEDSGPRTSIPSEVASCLYRVAEEGLQNIAKHSRAKGVSVRLDSRKRAIVLTIQDDGAGFDPKAVKDGCGLGLISMLERARSVKGSLAITAQLGHGTQISLEAPLPVSNL
jgi:signal transduction histidine kinase